MSLRTYSRRALSQRPARTILTILSIVIGVSAIVAVTILTQTTRGSYKLMFDTVVGRAALEVVSAGGSSYPEDIFAKVEHLPGVQAATPLVIRPSLLYIGEKKIRLQVMGVDPKRDPAVRDYEIIEGKPLSAGNQVVLDQGFAQHLGIKVGDQIRFLAQRRMKSGLKVVGLLKPKTAATLTQSGVAIMPLDRAQHYFSYRGRDQEIDSIQVVLKDDDQRDEVQAAIAQLLPEGVVVRPPGTSSSVMDETLMSSEQGLKLASRFSMLLSAFIILNTFMMNVGERRRQLAIMRAIGAKSGQLVWMLVRESILLGTVGTILGIGLGIGVAYVINTTLARVLVVNLPAPDQVTLSWAIGYGIFVGLAVAVIGALVPALRAGKVSPLEGMSRVAKTDANPRTMLISIVGVLLIVVCAALIAATIMGYLWIDVPIYAAIGCFVGLICLAPLVLGPLSEAVAVVLKPLARIEAGLALKQILRHQGRSTLTIGVLFLAAATGVGLSHSILDNITNLQTWLRAAIIGDVFVRAMNPDFSSGKTPNLPPEMDGEITSLQGIAHLDRVSYVELTLGDTTGFAIARQFDDTGKLPFDLVEGDEARLKEQLFAGEVVMASVLAQRMGKHAGDSIEIETPAGKQQLRIAGITNDYLVGGLGVYMQRAVAQKLLRLEGVDAYIVRSTPAALPALKVELEKIAEKHGVLIQSNAEIRANVNRIVSAVDWGLWALVYLGFVVAAFGVVNTLTMNVLEQTSELGLLRIVAMTKKQVRWTILMQAMILGGVGLVPGVLAGLAVAFVINLAMAPAFGHPIDFGFHPWLLVGALVGSLFITALAAFFPARRAAGINVVDALHYE